MPPDHLLPERLAAVLAVVYLIFNEGYGGRAELAAEAIRLGRVLAELMPDEPEVHGLLALMLLHDARRAARFAAASSCCSPTRTARCGTRRRSSAGARLLDARSRCAAAGPYVLQAAIASLQTADAIDWPQVAALYARARRVDRLARGGAQPRRRGRRGRRRPSGARASSTSSTSTATATCTRPAPSCCAGSAAPTRPARPTGARWSSPRLEPERRFLERRLAEL